MTSVPSAPPRETYSEGVLQAFAAVRVLADLAGELGWQPTVHASFTVHVHSAAEVDRAAAILGTTAEWCGPWSYRAVKCAGTVTVTVSYTSGPAAPADAATLGSLVDQARCEIPASAA